MIPSLYEFTNLHRDWSNSPAERNNQITVATIHPVIIGCNYTLFIVPFNYVAWLVDADFYGL